MTRGELLDMVIERTGLPLDKAMEVVAELSAAGDQTFSPELIDYVVEKLGLSPQPEPRRVANTPAPHMTMDPAEVLLEVNRVLPRMVPLSPGVHPDGRTHVPRIGRAPKDSVFYDEALRAEIEALPENIRVLIGSVDVIAGSVTFTLYDEANDIDHKIGPIELTRFPSGAEFRAAIDVLLGRLPRVLAADFN